MWWQILSFMCCLLVGCSESPHQKRSDEWMINNGKLKVLSTTGMVGDLVAQIGGEDVDSISLIAEQLDPHSYQLVKGDDEKFRRARLIFYSGLYLEHGPSLQAVLKDNPKAISFGEAIVSAKPESILHQGGQVDPHIWMDISLWAEAIPAIVKALKNADPSHSSSYEARAFKTQEKLMQAHKDVKKILTSIPKEKRFLITSHDAFNYFARAYLAEENELADDSWRERFAAPEGLAPDSQLSTADIQTIITYLEKHQVNVVFPESNVSKDSLRKIVDAASYKGIVLRMATEPLYGDAMGASGSSGSTYPEMILHNATVISSYLKGEH